MADELSLMVTLSFSKGGAKIPPRQVSKKVTITGDAFTHGVQTLVAASEAEIAQVAALGNPGWVLIINLDSTNFIEVGALTGEYTIKIEAGEFALSRHDIEVSATILALADTGNVNIEYFIIED